MKIPCYHHAHNPFARVRFSFYSRFSFPAIKGTFKLWVVPSLIWNFDVLLERTEVQDIGPHSPPEDSGVYRDGGTETTQVVCTDVNTQPQTTDVEKVRLPPFNGH